MEAALRMVVVQQLAIHQRPQTLSSDMQMQNRIKGQCVENNFLFDYSIRKNVVLTCVCVVELMKHVMQTHYVTQCYNPDLSICCLG